MRRERRGRSYRRGAQRPGRDLPKYEGGCFCWHSEPSVPDYSTSNSKASPQSVGELLLVSWSLAIWPKVKDCWGISPNAYLLRVVRDIGYSTLDRLGTIWR